MLIVHTESSLGWGGQEIRILTESRELIERGHRALVLADPDSLVAQRAALYKVTVELIPLKKKRPAEVMAMIRAINRLNPDVISCHSSTDHWVTAIARLFTKHPSPVVRTRHISAPIDKHPINRWLYRCGCEAIATTGEFIQEHLIANQFVSSEKVKSVPTGIDLGFYRPENQLKARLRVKTLPPISQQAMLFGNIATLRSWKGQHDLINAFASLEKIVPNVQLLLVGSGPQAENLLTLVKKLGLKEKVIFAGHQQDTRDYFDALDVFVFPSYANEGVPQAILQAMAYGLPIITTRIGAVVEAIKEYPIVNLVDARSVSQLSKAMLSWAKDCPSRVQLSERVRERIRLERMTEDMIKVYESVIRKP